MDIVECLGLLASALATFAFLPQVVKTWRTHSAHDFSLATLVMLEAGTGFWIVYGVLRGAPAIWLGNGVTLALAGFILLVKMRGGPARDLSQNITTIAPGLHHHPEHTALSGGGCERRAHSSRAHGGMKMWWPAIDRP